MTAHQPRTRISAWRPSVAGIAEVFHAHFADHAYPLHTHDTWDLMILDDGSVDFAVDRRRHEAADAGTVILLPPGVPHDGKTVKPSGFRKRVLYLDTCVLPERLTGSRSTVRSTEMDCCAVASTSCTESSPTPETSSRQSPG